MTQALEILHSVPSSQSKQLNKICLKIRGAEGIWAGKLSWEDDISSRRSRPEGGMCVYVYMSDVLDVWALKPKLNCWAWSVLEKLN